MATFTAIAAGITALAAVGGAAAAGIQARQAHTAGKRSRNRQNDAQAKAEASAAAQAREQRKELQAQSRREPDIAALIASAEDGFSSNTFLKGKKGTAGADGQLGRTKLIGE